MPAYPCCKCQAPVDTGSLDARCKKCGEQRPFKCTKCEKQMSQMGVFQPEKLSFRKPLYCLECGPATETVECRQCGTSMTRSNAREVTLRGQVVYYHPECYEKQAKVFRVVQPVALVAGVVIFGYLGFYVGHSWITALPGAGLGFLVGMALARPFAAK